MVSTFTEAVGPVKAGIHLAIIEYYASSLEAAPRENEQKYVSQFDETQTLRAAAVAGAAHRTGGRTPARGQSHPGLPDPRRGQGPITPGGAAPLRAARPGRAGSGGAGRVAVSGIESAFHFMPTPHPVFVR
jgi:hypothetical protein